MNFEFSRNLQGFESSQNVELNLINYHSEPAMLCRCKESCENPGVIRKINLPQLGEYLVKINGQADNNRTYIAIYDQKGRLLTSEPKFMNKKRGNVEIKFYTTTHQIRLGIFMGGESIAIPNNKFIIFNIKLMSKKKQAKRQFTNSEFKITRVFETVEDLNREKMDPSRGNQTPMEVGEYAILRNDTLNDDLYILSHRGLKYVSRIGMGRPSFFGESFHSIPGKTMPIFPNSDEAARELDRDPDNFYCPKGDYECSIQGDIYLYLDDQGYVRWLRHPTKHLTTESEQEKDSPKK